MNSAPNNLAIRLASVHMLSRAGFNMDEQSITDMLHGTVRAGHGGKAAEGVPFIK